MMGEIDIPNFAFCRCVFISSEIPRCFRRDLRLNLGSWDNGDIAVAQRPVTASKPGKVLPSLRQARTLPAGLSPCVTQSGRTLLLKLSQQDSWPHSFILH